MNTGRSPSTPAGSPPNSPGSPGEPGAPQKRPHSSNYWRLPKWKPELEATARLYARGYSYAKIGKLLHVGKDAVHHRIEFIRQHMVNEYKLDELPGAELIRHLVDVGLG